MNLLFPSEDPLSTAVIIPNNLPVVDFLHKYWFFPWKSSIFPIFEAPSVPRKCPHVGFGAPKIALPGVWGPPWPRPPYNISDSNITIGDPDIFSQTTKCLGMTFYPKSDRFEYTRYKELWKLSSNALKLTERETSSILTYFTHSTFLYSSPLRAGQNSLKVGVSD